jgi:hypothetical protein
MRKIVLLITVAITMVSCMEREEMNNRNEAYLHQSYYTTTIEGCEYIVYRSSNNFGMTHKGNCKNH